MSKINHVVLLTNDNEFKKYNGDRGNMFEKAKRFANRLHTQQEHETYCIIEFKPKCYIVCRIITEHEYNVFFNQEIGIVKKVTEEKILYRVGKENT